jgi:hypothetical protein
MQRSGALSVWMVIDVHRTGVDVSVSARGSQGQQTAPHALGPDLGVTHLGSFAEAVRRAAARGRPLGAELEQAQALHRAVLGDGVDQLRVGLGAAAGGPLLVRLMISDPELQAVPWEALAAPGEAMGFWGTSPDLSPVRGVITSEPWQPREVRGALRVLAIAPSDGPALQRLEWALAERVAAGEVEWLDPIKGPAARLPWLFERLRREPIPHVLHFLGHGGMIKGSPALRLADNDDGDESWLLVELLGQQLKAGTRGFLRLIVLEACEGAAPSAFASAAEILARAGADAVVAHLWPVKADVARTCSEQLYRALAGAGQGKGDIALSLNEARRAMLAAFDGSAEAFSPVVYLRGPDGVLFDFKGRKVAPPEAPPPPVSRGAKALDPALVRLVRRPFSLLLGDRWETDRAALDGFCDTLRRELSAASDPAPEGLSMSALAQRFALRRGVDELGEAFQEAFPGDVTIPPILSALARVLGPGVHTTLLRTPLLELALAEQQPERTFYTIQLREKTAKVLLREPGGGWKPLAAPPAALDLSQDIVLLRLYRGYTPDRIFTPPLLTEDDYLLGFRALEGPLPRDLANGILGALRSRPALIMGLSLLTWHHRMLLHHLFGKGPIAPGSLCVLDPEDMERELWEKGAGLPGGGDVGVVKAAVEDMAAQIRALSAGGEP